MEQGGWKIRLLTFQRVKPEPMVGQQLHKLERKDKVEDTLEIF